MFIGVEVEQETSAPPPKKDPGSAPVPFFSLASTTAQLFDIIAARETVTNLSGSTRAACVFFNDRHSSYDKLVDNINRPSYAPRGT